jgi:RNA polymerase sigma-70 factor (ECF subfamily)
VLSLIQETPRSTAGAADPARDELAGLAAAVGRHEAHAVRTFLLTIAGTVRGAVRTVLGPRHSDIDDVTQEATLGLLDALARFRGECTVAQFAGRVAVFTARAARRRQQTQERWVVADDAVGEATASDPDSSPLVQVEASRRREEVRRLLDHLSPVLGEAMVLYFVLGHTAEEIAAMTQVPINTVWSRLRLGKARLRRKLAGDASVRETRDG